MNMNAYRTWWLIAPAAGLLSMCALGAAPRETIGALSVQMPSGWTRHVHTGAVRYSANFPEPGRSCIIVLFDGQRGRGDARTDLMVQLGSTAPAVDARAVQTRNFRDGWVVAAVSSTGPKKESGERESATTLTFTREARTQSMVAVGNDERCPAALKAFLGEIQLASEQPPVPTNSVPSGSGALTGLWHGMSSTNVVAMHSNGVRDTVVIEPRVGASYVLFMRDGSYITEIPDRGIDADTLRQVSVYSRGTYQFDGHRVTLRGLAPGAAPRIATLSGGVLRMEEVELQKRPFADGQRFSGRFAVDSAGARPAIINFTADGRFEDKGALVAVRNERRGGGDLIIEPGGAGRYEVANCTVTFRYDDGRLTRLTLYAAEANELILATVSLTRLR
jgi:hypothetical protein